MADQKDDNQAQNQAKPQNPFQQISSGEPKKETKEAVKNPFEQVASKQNMEPADEGDEINAEVDEPKVVEAQVLKPAKEESLPVNPFAKISANNNHQHEKEKQEVPSFAKMKPVENLPKKVAAETAEPKSEAKIIEEITEIQPEDMGGFRKELFAILKQAGIGKSCLVGGIVSLLVLIAAYILIFTDFGVGNVTEKVSEEVSKVTEQVVGDSNENVETSESQDSFYLIGEMDELTMYIPFQHEFLAAYAFGMDENGQKEKLVVYIELLRRMQNVYETDLYVLLDKTANRRDLLTKYLSDLKSIIDEGDFAAAEVEQTLIRLNSQYESAVVIKDLNEKDFFVALKELYGERSYADLRTFVDYSKFTTEIRAYHSGYKAVLEMLQNSLVALKSRYDDVQANTEALVKGVRVFDIPGSDIKAIIRLGEK